MHILADAATTHPEVWKNWAYVGIGAALVLVGAGWDRAAKYSLPREDREEYETGCVPLLLMAAGVLMVLAHVFHLSL